MAMIMAPVEIFNPEKHPQGSITPERDPIDRLMHGRATMDLILASTIHRVESMTSEGCFLDHRTLEGAVTAALVMVPVESMIGEALNMLGSICPKSCPVDPRVL